MVTNVEQLSIDVSGRAYILRRGPWPFCRVFKGELNDITGIVVESDGGTSPWASHSWVQASVAWRDQMRRRFVLWSEDTTNLDAATEARATQALVARATELGARLKVPVA